jgi:hypothetical protein
MRLPGPPVLSPECEAAIDVPSPAERARHVEDAVRTLLSQPAYP